MVSRCSRRDLLRICVGPLLGIAGCLGNSSSDTGEPPRNDSPSHTSSSESTTETPSLSASDAKERALHAEQTYLETQLQNASCLSTWSASTPIASNHATVENQTSNGTYVRVKHGYSYSGEKVPEADGISEALYLVTEENSERVSGRAISPC